jgi:selenocysteine-specific elongation factor
MLAGATGIDLLLLVVAADESVMPQTREHLGICRLLGLSAGVIALTRIDLAGDELTELAADEVAETVRGTFLDGAPIVRVSGVTGAGLPALEAALVDGARRLAPRPDGPWPRLPVDRVFTSRGFGTVVTGTLTGGSLRVGQPLAAVPGEIAGRIRGLQVHGAAVEEAAPRQRVAVNIQGVDRENVTRGMVLVPQGHGVTTRVFDAQIEMLLEAPGPLEDGQRVRVHHGTAEIMGRTRLPAPGRIEPGAAGTVQFRLESPLAALPGDRFVVRRYSPAVTLGGGVIADLDPPRWRRADTDWPEHVAQLAAASDEQRLALAALRAGDEGVAVAERALRLGMPRARAAAAATDLAGAGGANKRWTLLAGDLLLATPALDALREKLRRVLSAHHRAHPLEPGLAPERLRAAVAPTWGPDPFRHWLTALAAAGAIAASPEAVRLASHRGELEGAERETYARMLRALQDTGLHALGEQEWLSEAGAGAEAKRLVPFAIRRGEALRLSDGAFVSLAAWDGLLSRLGGEAAAGRTVLDVAAFKDLFGLSRKYAIPLLEKLDDAGVTQRVGNERRIRATWLASRERQNGE